MDHEHHAAKRGKSVHGRERCVVFGAQIGAHDSKPGRSPSGTRQSMQRAADAAGARRRAHRKPATGDWHRDGSRPDKVPSKLGRVERGTEPIDGGVIPWVFLGCSERVVAYAWQLHQLGHDPIAVELVQIVGAERGLGRSCPRAPVEASPHPARFSSAPGLGPWGSTPAT